MRQYTARDFWRIHCCDALMEGQAHARNEAVRPTLTETERYAAVVEAKRLRNFWFTSQLMSRDILEISVDGVDFFSQTSDTPRFSEPVIITDMLSMHEPPLSKSVDEPFLLARIQQYGGEGNSYGLDFFNTDTPLVSWLTLKHERNHETSGDLLDKYLPCTPHLLRPYETLRARYYYPANDPPVEVPPLKFCGFRAVRVLAASSPYAQLSALADRQVRSYIKGSSPETFFMEVKTPLASLGAINVGSVELRTPQQQRPLLILGAACNVQGVQARISDESAYYQFTYQDKPLPDSGVFPAGPQWYTDPPLSIVAPNTDFRNVGLFNMWPVPHVLEPGASLRIVLKNGTIPYPLQSAMTRGNPVNGRQDVRITFLCRTP